MLRGLGPMVWRGEVGGGRAEPLTFKAAGTVVINRALAHHSLMLAERVGSSCTICQENRA